MLLAGGIDWARLVVRDHGKREAVTRKDQIWATPSWTRASSVPATSAWPCSPAGWRTNRASTTCTTWRAPGAAAAEEQVLLRLLGLLRLPDTLAPRIIDIVAMGQPPAQPAEAAAARSRPPARRCRAACRLGAALGLIRRARRTATHHDAAAREHAGQRQHRPARSHRRAGTRPVDRQARAIAGERDRAMPSTIAATSPTAWRAPASGHAARRRHRQRLVHGARRGGLERARLTAQALLRATPAAPATVWMREDN